jgi:hypothetical protein
MHNMLLLPCVQQGNAAAANNLAALAAGGILGASSSEVSMAGTNYGNRDITRGDLHELGSSNSPAPPPLCNDLVPNVASPLRGPSRPRPGGPKPGSGRPGTRPSRPVERPPRPGPLPAPKPVLPPQKEDSAREGEDKIMNYDNVPVPLPARQ